MVWRRWCFGGSDLLRFEVGDKRGAGVSEGDRYGLSIEFGSLGAGVGVVDGEEESSFFGAGGFEAVGFDGGHIDESYVFVCG